MMMVKKRIGFNVENSSKSGLLKILFLILLMFVISVPLSSCKKEKKVEKENLINVRVAAAQKKTVRPYIETTGSLRADEEVTVSSEVDGIVKSIKVEEGSAVSKGSLLVEINQTDYRLDKQRAEAAMKQAEASLANVKSEFQRKESLFKEELITRQQYDDISTRVILAEADMAKAKSMLESSAERFARTRIYSPINGMV
jgi:membrane fusion protein, multidrug efflux system